MHSINQRHHFGPGEHVAGPQPPLQVDATRQMLMDAHAVAAVLVEGWSDQAAVQSLAVRRGCDLAAGGIAVLPMGGVANFSKFVAALGSDGLGLRLAGLCDAAEETRMSPVSSSACDLVASSRVKALRNSGSSCARPIWRTNSFGRWAQNQSSVCSKRAHMQLHRFMGTRALRKIRYGSLLVEALQLERVPNHAAANGAACPSSTYRPACSSRTQRPFACCVKY